MHLKLRQNSLASSPGLVEDRMAALPVGVAAQRERIAAAEKRLMINNESRPYRKDP
jgi:hypothetical protein